MATLHLSSARDTLVSNALNSQCLLVNDCINSALVLPSEALIDPVIDAAREVKLAVGNAFVAYNYAGTLDKLEEEVDGNVKDQLEDLRNMVGVLVSRRNSEILGLYARAQSFIQSLKLQSWQPKLTGVTPRYCYIVGNTLTVSFSGLFDYAAKHKSAVLQLGKDRFKVAETILIDGVSTKVSKESLSFVVQLPPEALMETSQKCRIMRAVLEVDYDVGTVSTHPKMASYEVSIGVYPLGPGEVNLKYSKREVVRVDQRTFKSSTFSLSRKGLSAEGTIQKQFRVLPTPDWKITGTPQIHVEGITVDFPADRFTPDHVDVVLSLPTGQDKVKGHVEFDETHEVVEVKEHSEVVSLKWGESFYFNAPTFTATLKDFEGKESVLTDTKRTTSYLQVVGVDGKYSLVAQVPKQ